MELTENNINSFINSESTVIVDFWASWCVPCSALSKTLEDPEFTGRVGKVNVEEQTELTDKYKIKGLPTMIFFKNGEIINQISGAYPKDIILKYLNNDNN